MKWYDYIIIITIGGLIGWVSMDLIVNHFGHNAKSLVVGLVTTLIFCGLWSFGYVKFTFWRDGI